MMISTKSCCQWTHLCLSLQHNPDMMLPAHTGLGLWCFKYPTPLDIWPLTPCRPSTPHPSHVTPSPPPDVPLRSTAERLMSGQLTSDWPLPARPQGTHLSVCLPASLTASLSLTNANAAVYNCHIDFLLPLYVNTICSDQWTERWHDADHKLHGLTTWHTHTQTSTSMYYIHTKTHKHRIKSAITKNKKGRSLCDKGFEDGPKRKLSTCIMGGPPYIPTSRTSASLTSHRCRVFLTAPNWSLSSSRGTPWNGPIQVPCGILWAAQIP